MPEVLIAGVGPADAGEVLTLQRAAYVSEAQLYQDVSLPPLTESYAELAAALASGTALKAMLGHRMVGACRGHLDGTTLHIGRLTVAPDLQGQGIGTLLLRAIELQAPSTVDRYALFTGELSTGNLRLYERLGYRRTGTVAVHPGLSLIHLEKQRVRPAV